MLRISGNEERLRQRSVFDLLRAHYCSGVRCSQPFEYGEDSNRGLCYVLVGYIPGNAASDELPNLPNRHSTSSEWRPGWSCESSTRCIIPTRTSTGMNDVWRSLILS